MHRPIIVSALRHVALTVLVLASVLAVHGLGSALESALGVAV